MELRPLFLLIAKVRAMARKDHLPPVCAARAQSGVKLTFWCA